MSEFWSGAVACIIGVQGCQRLAAVSADRYTSMKSKPPESAMHTGSVGVPGEGEGSMLSWDHTTF